MQVLSQNSGQIGCVLRCDIGSDGRSWLKPVLSTCSEGPVPPVSSCEENPTV